MSDSQPAFSPADTTVERVPVYGSDVIVDVLHDLGIEYAAFNPGATFRGIHDSLVNYAGNHRPEIIECCHEEISVAIAHGYAKATGKPMAAITHNIVGLQHASMAIFNAWCDRVPMLVLGATGPMDATRRRPWIDWVHTALVQGNVVRDYVKWDDQPYSVEAVPDSLLRAHQLAVSPPCGPVYVCFDVALQEDPLQRPVQVPAARDFAIPSTPGPDPAALLAIADRLVAASHPVIITDFVGRSDTGFHALVELAERLGIAVIDHGGRLSFPTDHPLNLSGLAEEVLPKADVILALDVLDLNGALLSFDRRSRGTRRYLPDQTASILSVSLNNLATRSWSNDFQRLQPTSVTLTADTAIALPMLLDLVKTRLDQDGDLRAASQARTAEIAERHAALRREWLAQATEVRDLLPISSARLSAELYDAVRSHDWVVANGDLDGWVKRLWGIEEPGQHLGKCTGAGLGYGLGASIGAALAHRDSGKLCIDIQSDGDFLFTPSALWTAARHRIPLLIVMWNNGTYYNSEQHQLVTATARGRSVESSSIGTLLEDPRTDFAALARSFGVQARGPVEDPAELGEALRWGVEVVREQRRPALIDVRGQKK